MYYLIEREQLPEELQGNYFEGTPDGRIIISDYTAKVCNKLENVDCYPTKWALDAALKEMKGKAPETPETDGSKEENTGTESTENTEGAGTESSETEKNGKEESETENKGSKNEEKDLIKA